MSVGVVCCGKLSSSDTESINQVTELSAIQYRHLVIIDLFWLKYCLFLYFQKIIYSGLKVYINLNNICVIRIIK